jgi:twitching motility protein PilT
VILSGGTGSGKSTTLASLINEINKTQEKHIITIEDPIEFVHPHGRCVVNQREVGSDVENFADAVRSAMREDPDILLVGEMRDLETIQNAITMAETGHLVFATLHTRSAAETIDRIIDVFPPAQQQQVRVQLSSILQGIISQTLVPSVSGGRVPVCEVMFITDAIKSIIKENGPHSSLKDQILFNHKKLGSYTFEQSLAFLYKKGLINRDIAFEHTKDIETFKRMVQY